MPSRTTFNCALHSTRKLPAKRSHSLASAQTCVYACSSVTSVLWHISPRHMQEASERCFLSKLKAISRQLFSFSLAKTAAAKVPLMAYQNKCIPSIWMGKHFFQNGIQRNAWSKCFFLFGKVLASPSLQSGRNEFTCAWTRYQTAHLGMFKTTLCVTFRINIFRIPFCKTMVCHLSSFSHVL